MKHCRVSVLFFSITLFFVACSPEEDLDYQTGPLHSRQLYSLIYDEAEGHTVFRAEAEDIFGKRDSSTYTLFVNGREVPRVSGNNPHIRQIKLPGEVNEVAVTFIDRDEQYTYQFFREQIERISLPEFSLLFRNSMDTVHASTPYRPEMVTFAEFYRDEGPWAFSYLLTQRHYPRDTTNTIRDTVTYWSRRPLDNFIYAGTHDLIVELKRSQGAVYQDGWVDGIGNDYHVIALFTSGVRYRAGEARVVD